MKDKLLSGEKIFDEIANISFEKIYETRIKIGRVVFSILTDDYNLEELMKERFCGFFSQDEPTLSIKIQIKNTIPLAPEKSNYILIDKDKMFFNRGSCYAGIVDFEQKKGRI